MIIEIIAFIIIFAILGLGITGVLLHFWREENSVGALIGAITSLIVTAAICIFAAWWNLNTESGRRALKDQQSNLSGGIERTVSVYDINGTLIKRYSGKFDIETDKESYILFDDEDGDRHIVYYTTGTIIVDEGSIADCTIPNT